MYTYTSPSRACGCLAGWLPAWMPCGRFPKFHRVFLGREPGTLKSDIVSNKTSTISLFGIETLKLKFRRLNYGNRPWLLGVSLLCVVYLYMCIYIHIYTHIHVHICMCIYIYIYIYVYIYIYTHMCITLSLSIYIYIYIHTHIHIIPLNVLLN